MNYSIKRFLLIYITLAILVIYALISLASYRVSKEELDELYDANLQQVANSIAAQHLAIHDDQVRKRQQLHRHLSGRWTRRGEERKRHCK